MTELSITICLLAGTMNRLLQTHQSEVKGPKMPSIHEQLVSMASDVETGLSGGSVHSNGVNSSGDNVDIGMTHQVSLVSVLDLQ